MQKTCKNCIYWEHRGENSNLGECRFNPPTVIESPMVKWPVTEKTEWCSKLKSEIQSL